MSAKYVSAKCSSRFLLTLQLRVCLASVFNFFLVATLRLCCDVSGKAPSSLSKLLVLLPQTQLEMAHLAVAGHCPPLLLPQTWQEMAWTPIENIWSQRLSENIQWSHPYKCCNADSNYACPLGSLFTCNSIAIPSTSRCESLLTNMSVRYIT